MRAKAFIFTILSTICLPHLTHAQDSRPSDPVIQLQRLRWAVEEFSASSDVDPEPLLQKIGTLISDPQTGDVTRWQAARTRALLLRKTDREEESATALKDLADQLASIDSPSAKRELAGALAELATEQRTDLQQADALFLQAQELKGAQLWPSDRARLSWLKAEARLRQDGADAKAFAELANALSASADSCPGSAMLTQSIGYLSGGPEEQNRRLLENFDQTTSATTDLSVLVRAVLLHRKAMLMSQGGQGESTQGIMQLAREEYESIKPRLSLEVGNWVKKELPALARPVGDGVEHLEKLFQSFQSQRISLIDGFGWRKPNARMAASLSSQKYYDQVIGAETYPNIRVAARAYKAWVGAFGGKSQESFAELEALIAEMESAAEPPHPLVYLRAHEALLDAATLSKDKEKTRRALDKLDKCVAQYIPDKRDLYLLQRAMALSVLDDPGFPQATIDYFNSFPEERQAMLRVAKDAWQSAGAQELAAVIQAYSAVEQASAYVEFVLGRLHERSYKLSALGRKEDERNARDHSLSAMRHYVQARRKAELGEPLFPALITSVNQRIAELLGSVADFSTAQQFIGQSHLPCAKITVLKPYF